MDKIAAETAAGPSKVGVFSATTASAAEITEEIAPAALLIPAVFVGAEIPVVIAVSMAGTVFVETGEGVDMEIVAAAEATDEPS